MSAALAFAFVVASAGTASAAPQRLDAAQLLTDACVTTDLDRSAFERVAAERGWRQLRITSNTGGPDGWATAFRSGSATLMMNHVPIMGAADDTVGTACSLSVGDSPPSLRDEVAALAVGLGFNEEPTSAEVAPGQAPVEIWSRFGDRTLTYARAADGRAVISLSRQIVTRETAPVSPPGT